MSYCCYTSWLLEICLTLASVWQLLAEYQNMAGYADVQNVVCGCASSSLRVVLTFFAEVYSGNRRILIGCMPCDASYGGTCVVCLRMGSICWILFALCGLFLMAGVFELVLLQSGGHEYC